MKEILSFPMLLLLRLVLLSPDAPFPAAEPRHHPRPGGVAERLRPAHPLRDARDAGEVKKPAQQAAESIRQEPGRSA